MNVRGVITLERRVHEGVCRVRRELLGAERTEAFRYASPCTFDISIDANAPLREQYADVVGAVRQGAPVFFRASGATTWAVVLPVGEDDEAARRERAQEFMLSGVGSVLLVAASASWDQALTLYRQRRGERAEAFAVDADELARIRARQLAGDLGDLPEIPIIEGAHDIACAWARAFGSIVSTRASITNLDGTLRESGRLGAVAEGALTRAWQLAVDRLFAQWERAVHTEAGVRATHVISAYRRAVRRREFDPRESSAIVEDQMEKALAEYDGHILLDAVLRTVRSYLVETAGLAPVRAVVDNLAQSAIADELVADVQGVLKRVFARALERETRWLTWPEVEPAWGFTLVDPEAEPAVGDGAPLAGGDLSDSDAPASPADPNGGEVPAEPVVPCDPDAYRDPVIAEEIARCRPLLEALLVGEGMAATRATLDRMMRAVLDDLERRMLREWPELSAAAEGGAPYYWRYSEGKTAFDVIAYR